MKTVIKLKSESNPNISRIDIDDLTIEDIVQLQSMLTEALEAGLDDTNMLENGDRLQKAYENAIKISETQQKNLLAISKMWKKINAG